MDPWQIVVMIAGSATIVEQAWSKGIVPLYRLVRGTVAHIEADPVLLEIAERFRPNAGTSLHDRIIHIEETQSDHGDQITELATRVDTFIMERRPGGRRKTDPRRP